MLFLDPTFNALAVQSSEAGNTLSFSGHVYDAESGLFSCRSRMYHAQLGSFTTRDPIGYAARDENLYRYVHDCPTTLVDPSGLLPFGVFPIGTRVKGSLGCVPAFWGLSLCINYDVSANVVLCDCTRACVVLQVNIEVGLYVTGTVGPQYPVWPPNYKMLPVGPGGIKWPVPNFPVNHGITVGCPPPGCHGSLCASASIGITGVFMSATVGCQYCYYPSTGGSFWKCGTNIGTGTGIGGGGGITCTKCF